MRFIVAVVLMLIMTVPAWAQNGNNAGHNFGRITCPQPVPCPGDSSVQSLSSSALASQASSCVSLYFGYANPSGFFDDSSGLDVNSCLAPIPGVLPKGVGSQLIPSCCVVKDPTSGTCQFHCELNTAG